MTVTATRSGRVWKERLPPERAYKRRAGILSPAVEQDRAAGGRHRRSVALGDGSFARASISLRLYRRTRRVRAYLRWYQDGGTQERYIGEVGYDTRGANLAEAWRRAWAEGLLAEEPLPSGSRASSRAARAVMLANRSRDTGPELALRSLIHARGLRYRVDVRPLAGIRRRADVVFPKERIAVFVDGCFWHGCPEHCRPARTNAEAWATKIEANRARDTDTNELLRTAGWTVIRVWEHEDLPLAADMIERTVQAVRRTVGQ
ncbi:very short patch repair endonuclease [Embleya scabrispora]|uniref:very short patch repair endonuclease n=1 Tax=Embleya scabrispora TaxID=159449 RepID=UPI000381758C|nr:very short patch repair endonuclease [Embleya scabrispora]MYS81396.1 DNA mismatch endonuclease Vsr [Streptomyces sp. SID5474]